LFGKSKRLEKINKHRRERKLSTVAHKMSLKLGLNRVQEVLVMALMIVLVFALWSNLELMYKISIGVIVFALILLTSMAAQVLKQAEERKPT
jgi:hypothetical protein